MSQNPKEVFVFCAALSDRGTPVGLWRKYDIVSGKACLQSISSSILAVHRSSGGIAGHRHMEKWNDFLYNWVFWSLWARNAAGTKGCYVGLSIPPNSTATVLSHGFHTAQIGRQLQAETAAESWANEAATGLKIAGFSERCGVCGVCLLWRTRKAGSEQLD